MIGLPGQTIRHLVKDLRFFQEYDIDMIGMGPYIPHEDTPLGAGIRLTEDYRKHQLELGLKMIACARLLLRDVNIASTTALQALDPQGERTRASCRSECHHAESDRHSLSERISALCRKTGDGREF